jgi:hypothetical protein
MNSEELEEWNNKSVGKIFAAIERAEAKLKKEANEKWQGVMIKFNHYDYGMLEYKAPVDSVSVKFINKDNSEDPYIDICFNVVIREKKSGKLKTVKVRNLIFE